MRTCCSWRSHGVWSLTHRHALVAAALLHTSLSCPDTNSRIFTRARTYTQIQTNVLEKLSCLCLAALSSLPDGTGVQGALQGLRLLYRRCVLLYHRCMLLCRRCVVSCLGSMLWGAGMPAPMASEVEHSIIGAENPAGDCRPLASAAICWHLRLALTAADK